MPERDLQRLLAALDPKLSGERYSFDATESESLGEAFALIREEEGITVIRPKLDGEWALISIGIHSSLDAVGLTAALATALADAGISANMIAGLRHDHLFVPWGRREEALRVLRGIR
jgi:uncharacterized protein